jgi:hypothetical protein
MYNLDIDHNYEPHMPDTCVMAATLLVLLALKKSVCRFMLTDSPDHFEDCLRSLARLGWQLERSQDGQWVSLAEGAVPPAPGYPDYETYVWYRVNDKYGWYVRNTLVEEIFPRLENRMRFSDRKLTRTVAPGLRPGESTARSYEDDDGDSGHATSTAVAALG